MVDTATATSESPGPFGERRLRFTLLGTGALAAAVALYAAWDRANLGAGDPLTVMAVAATVTCAVLYRMVGRVRDSILEHAFILIITGCCWTISFWSIARGHMDAGAATFVIPLTIAIFMWPVRSALLLAGATLATFVFTWSMGWIGPASAEATIILGVTFPFFAAVLAWMIGRERSLRNDLAATVHDERNELRAVLWSNTDAVLGIRNGAMHLANPAAEKFLQTRQVQANAPLGQLLAALPPLAAGKVDQAYETARAGGTGSAVISLEKSIGSGEADPTHHVLARRANGPNSSIVLTLQDVRAQYEAIRAEAAARDDSRRRTLNLVTHQLTTPLMPILLESTVWARRLNDDHPDLRHSLEVIERNARRAVDMVHLLIDASRDHPGQAEAWERLEPAWHGAEWDVDKA